MSVYLPIADVAVNVWLIIALGGGVGLISGLFGVGGGFLLTPLLIMGGVPPAVAVATQAPQIVASATSGTLSYWRRELVDFRLGGVLVACGLVGSWVGVWIFGELQQLGQVEFVVKAIYVVMLTFVGGLMGWESFQVIRGLRQSEAEAPRKAPQIFDQLPFRWDFVSTDRPLSVLLPIVIGFSIGALGAIIGVGGGFVMVPAMIYLLGVRTPAAIGTSLFQLMVVMAGTTIFHSVETGAVDAVLALLLLTGGVVGAQIGAFGATRIKAASLRFLLALLVLGFALSLAVDLTWTPDERFSIERAAAGGLHGDEGGAQ